jgi:2-keto-4-pentenoate hydratase/2-oxohepta-3-ene-1,7-dioic acid hydratase in catechol pathway
VKIVRFIHKDRECFGVVEGSLVNIALGSPFETLRRTGETVPLAGLELLSPCMPGKALCIGLNYQDHAIEFGLPIPTAPVVFMKPSTSVIAPAALIEKPAMCRRLDYEAELVVVIGKKAKNVTADKAADYILGYTCGNDITARDLQPKEGQWTVAKGFDTFLPFGPWIETEIDPSNLRIRALLNGERKQSSNTSNLIFPVPELVAYLSSVMTLEPGDIIMTGTPSGIGPMESGDEIIVEIEGIGSLVNHVK